MGLFRKKEQRAAETTAVTDEESLLKAFIGGTSYIDKTSAMEIPAVQACVDLISDVISTLPICLYEEKKGEVKKITDDIRVHLLNKDTGDVLNGTALKKLWVLDYFLGKGAYTYIDRDIYGNVKGLYYVDESRVSIVPNVDPIFKDYTISVNGKGYLRSDFIKILRKSKGDGKGTSVIKESETLLLVAYNTMKYENAIVKKGGNKRGFLTSQTQQTKGSMDAVKAAWGKMFSNSQDAEDNICVLNAGMDFKEASATSLEMQLNENKKTNSDEVCRLFCVPPSIFSAADEKAKQAFISNCITPMLNMIEAALDSDLLKESEKVDRYFAFDTRELTRGNISERYRAYEIGLNNGFLQLSDVRDQEDLPPIDFPFIKLGGLNNVFYDPIKKTIYTPNTNETAVMGGNSNKMQEVSENALQEIEGRSSVKEAEYRFKGQNRKPNGQFDFDDSGKKSKKSLTNTPKRSNIKTKAQFSKSERNRVSSAILTDHPNLPNDGIVRHKNYGDYTYDFIVKGSGEYKFIGKHKIKGRDR